MLVTVENVRVEYTLVRYEDVSRFYEVRHEDATETQMHVILHGDDRRRDRERLTAILDREIRLGLDKGWPRGVLAEVRVIPDAKEPPEIS